MCIRHEWRVLCLERVLTVFYAEGPPAAAAVGPAVLWQGVLMLY
jgi:hypothetical protein